ncbi:hypothetical protein CEXT_766851 [Caerostris extrusa]|uniref:Uncharacterized protein n=1 Tax=Caerostris extrusa TaxID=172846 RepID=A0AAV4Y603_CAEEX|nr:hypothetical protein CEXT_766851 [Caerostris extrusa]
MSSPLESGLFYEDKNYDKAWWQQQLLEAPSSFTQAANGVVNVIAQESPSPSWKSLEGRHKRARRSRCGHLKVIDSAGIRLRGVFEDHDVPRFMA